MSWRGRGLGGIPGLLGGGEGARGEGLFAPLIGTMATGPSLYNSFLGTHGCTPSPNQEQREEVRERCPVGRVELEWKWQLMGAEGRGMGRACGGKG